MSVPQIAVLRMRMRMSLWPISGGSVSMSSSPWAGRSFANARMLWVLWSVAGNHAQGAAHACKGLDSLVDLLGSVRRTHLCTDSSLPLWNHRIREANDIDALVQQGIGHARRKRRIAQHHRNDGVFTRDQVKAQLLHGPSETASVGMDALAL